MNSANENHRNKLSMLSKTALWTLSALLGCAALSGAAQKPNQQLKPNQKTVQMVKSPLFVHQHARPANLKYPPRLPPVKGCYKLVQGKWENAPCLTEEFVNAHYPHPEYLPAIEFGQASNAGNTPSMPITGGAVDINIGSLGSETDTLWGPNAFSIQLNTNGFMGNNGHRDWVQFTTQHKPTSNGQTEDLVCIWSVDLDVGHYHPVCLNQLPGRSVRAGDFASIQGYQDFQDKGHLMISVQLSWVNDEATYGLVVDDRYGLIGKTGSEGNWQEVFGSILGYGGSSTANFSKSSVWVGLDAYNCEYDTDLACVAQNPGNWTWSATKPYTKVSAGTGEQNNLQPTVNNGPTTTSNQLPGLSCPGWAGCSIEYEDSIR